jgi:hypothetical protein
MDRAAVHVLDAVVLELRTAALEVQEPISTRPPSKAKLSPQ